MENFFPDTTRAVINISPFHFLNADGSNSLLRKIIVSALAIWLPGLSRAQPKNCLLNLIYPLPCQTPINL
jgi:hypothetical protein